MLSFIIPLERVLFDDTKSINELKEFFITHCTKKNNMQIFYSLLQWSTKNDEAFLTVNYLKKNKRTTNKRNYSIKRSEEKLFYKKKKEIDLTK